MAQDKKKNEWLEWIKAILVALILVLILRTFVFSASVVEGESMSPTLEHGNKIIFNKFVYLIGDPERNDVVIIQRPLKNYVKRVIGLPGEVIEIRNHILRSEEHTSELQSRGHLVCRLLLEKQHSD